MTTDLTIDGVRRELLERCARELSIGIGPAPKNRAQELRALLDAPVVESELSRMTRRCQNAELALKVQTENYEALKAAQPQGEPVSPFYISKEDWNTLVRDDVAIALIRTNRRKGKVFTEPLYAEQPAPVAVVLPFQSRVRPWMMECFGEAIAADSQERNHRFLEEALELVQANQCTAGEAHQLVDYVFGRPVGEPSQEVGGVMVTLAALCLAAGLDMHAAGETELARIWTKVEQIRAKQAAKPAMSPLPGAHPDREQSALSSLVRMCDCNQGRFPCNGECKP